MVAVQQISYIIYIHEQTQKKLLHTKVFKLHLMAAETNVLLSALALKAHVEY